MSKLQRKIIHSLRSGELLIEFPDLNQAVLIGNPRPAIHDMPLTAAVITDLRQMRAYAKRGHVPALKWSRLIHLSQP